MLEYSLSNEFNNCSNILFLLKPFIDEKWLIKFCSITKEKQITDDILPNKFSNKLILFIFSFKFKFSFRFKVPFIKLLFIYIFVVNLFPLLGSIINIILFHSLYLKKSLI